MSYFTLPSANTEKQITITNFGGIDLHSSPEGISINRSPDMLNMIRDKNGSLRKRMGYEKIASLGATIYGGCTFNGVNYVHAGEGLFAIDEKGTRQIASGLTPQKSMFIKRPEKLYALFYGELLCIDKEENCTSVYDNGYIPTVIISKSPSGGGELYEEFNRISEKWREQFLADGESKTYCLWGQELSAVISVEIRDDSGEFKTVDPSLYTVDLLKGEVTFSTAPPKYTVAGMDSVRITAEDYSLREENAMAVWGCTVGIVYGANGREDRLFLGGSDECVGMDFFSAAGDFSYFPMMNYSKLSDRGIVGYSIHAGSLYTHFQGDSFYGDSLVVKRNGGEDQTFLITDKFYAPNMVSPHTAASLEGEGLYFSPTGVYGITVSDVTQEKVCQKRSGFMGDFFSDYLQYYLKNAHATVFSDFYALSVGGDMVILDGRQKRYFEGEPLCSFQYECYVFSNICAHCSWTDGQRLYFGDVRGNVYGFYTDKESQSSYNDDGKKIRCYFETAYINGGWVFGKKNVVSVNVKIGAFKNTGVCLHACTDGMWHDIPLYDSTGRAGYIDFEVMDFGTISFSPKKSEMTIEAKTRIRKVDSVRFRLENYGAEPFALIAIGAKLAKQA